MCRDSRRGSCTRWRGRGEDRAPAAEGPQIHGDHACKGEGAEGVRHSSSGAITHPREGRAFAGIYQGLGGWGATVRALARSAGRRRGEAAAVAGVACGSPGVRMGRRGERGLPGTHARSARPPAAGRRGPGPPRASSAPAAPLACLPGPRPFPSGRPESGRVPAGDPTAGCISAEPLGAERLVLGFPE